MRLLQFRWLATVTLIPAALVNPGCKLNSAKMAFNDRPCTESELQSLQSQLQSLQEPAPQRAFPNMPVETIALTGDAQSEALIRRYTLDYSLESSGFNQALSTPRGSDWRTYTISGCAAYAQKIAEGKCGSFGCGWFGIDRTNSTYVQHRDRARSECMSSFDAYFTERDAAQPGNLGSNPGNNNPGGQNGTVPGNNQNIGPQNDANSRNREARIADLTTRIEICKEQIARQAQNGGNAQVSEFEFKQRCEQAGGTATYLEPPFQCQCGSGRQIDPFKERSCSTVADAEGLCNQLQGTAWDKTIGVCYCVANPEFRSANTWSIRNTLGKQCSGNSSVNNNNTTPPAPVNDNPAPKPSSCQCVSQNGQCHKVVDGRIVASLTPFMNNVTGRQETCSPGGGGGYDNLCNQPQLKCQ